VGSGIAKFIGMGFGDTSADSTRSVAVVSDRYFLVEENGFPRESLKHSEIRSLAKSTISGMLPASGNETVSGFFIDEAKNSMTTFVASRERLLSEIPQLQSCKYWVSEKFFREKVSSELEFPQEEKCVVISIDSGGICSVGDSRCMLFSQEFWNAEMHDDAEKSINRKIEFIDGLYNKAIFPLLSGVAALLLLLVCLCAVRIVVSLRSSVVERNSERAALIMERSKLRDEISLFSAGKLSYLRRLKTVANVRPGGLLFSSFSYSNPKVVNFIGECESVSILNGFIGKLKNVRSVRNVSETNVVSSMGHVSFNLKVEFL
jgi:hypothetical protein